MTRSKDNQRIKRDCIFYKHKSGCMGTVQSKAKGRYGMKIKFCNPVCCSAFEVNL
jgi:hypothetical protein